MHLFIISLLVPFLLGLTCALLLFYYLTRNHNYWQKKGIPYAKPSLFFGNTKDIALIRTTIGLGVAKIYKEYENLPFVGFFEMDKPVLLLRDLEIIKNVLMKDFAHFQGRGFATNTNDPLTTYNLVNLTGSQWQILRTKMNAAFTACKVRYVFGNIAEAAKKYNNFIDQYADAEEPVEIQDLAAKFTTEVMSTCYFGLETNPLQSIENEFRAVCKLVMEPSLGLHVKRLIRYYLPSVFKWLRLSLNPHGVTDYFMNLVKDIVTYREVNHVQRQDLIQILIGLMSEKIDKHTNDSNGMTVDEKIVAAQVYTIFMAGFETTATALAFAMYELAKHPEIQQKLQEEIQEALREHKSFSYEAITDMKYLDCVVRETLRKHPPFGTVVRVCNKAYKIPGTDIVIDEGTKILIPIHGIHHDPLYHEEPEKFKPERFLEQNFRNAGTYIPFSAGPRICIGMALSYAQIKAGLVALLSDYEVIMHPKTSSPIVYAPTAQTLTSQFGIWLNIRRLSKITLSRSSTIVNSSP